MISNAARSPTVPQFAFSSPPIPKFPVPRHNRLTFSPDLPKLLYSIPSPLKKNLTTKTLRKAKRTKDGAGAAPTPDFTSYDVVPKPSFAILRAFVS